MKRILFVALVLGLAVLAAPSVMARDGDGVKVIDRDSVAYGRTYSEWSAAWQQWALSIPVAEHPLFDNGPCSVGQSGPVWFLGGKFCAVNNPNCGTSNVVRSCSVPAGTALYIPVLNAEWSVLETNNPLEQIDDLRSLAASDIDGTSNEMDIDGRQIRNLLQDFRVQSAAFVFTIPNDNLFNAVGEGPYPGGSYFPGLDDGVYVMLAPLRSGPHKIHFHGFMPAFNFTLDVTYNLTVAGK
jgi:hypothetical protein